MRGRQESSSFLKKRTKKLLAMELRRVACTRTEIQSFFASFFQKSGPSFAFLLLCTAAFGQEPPATVSTMTARTMQWQTTISAVGSLRAVKGADLAAEISGIVDWIGFDSGRDVAAGTVLVKLRLNDDTAKLAELQAAADLAATSLARDEKQLHAQAVSQATIDADESHLRAARAQVAAQQALIDEKIIRAPFAGRLGLRMVDEGQYLPAGTMIVTLQALDPIYVDFFVPQQAIPSIAPAATAGVTFDAYPNRIFAAHVTAISPKLDAASRMAQVRAILPNPDHALLPGMFATVSIATGAAKPYITIPDAAVVYNPYGSSVYVLSGGTPQTVRQVMIKTGQTRGDQVAVLEGLHDGDVVVTAGQLKLHRGSTVAVNNSVQPAFSANPHPAEE
jgi:membrane fusion protein (multidrug efflux system)